MRFSSARRPADLSRRADIWVRSLICLWVEGLGGEHSVERANGGQEQAPFALAQGRPVEQGRPMAEAQVADLRYLVGLVGLSTALTVSVAYLPTRGHG
jgi:hypothetical protein